MIAPIGSEGATANPLQSALAILYALIGILIVAVIVLLIVTAYRKRHGYKEKTAKKERDEKQWWANPYDLSDMAPEEERREAGEIYSIEPLREDGRAEKGNHRIEPVAEGKTPDAVRFCRRCGKRIPKDSLFCQYCGTEVEI